MIKIGEKFSFVPHWIASPHDNAWDRKIKSVTGTVIYVNREHKNFCVEYHCGGMDAKETFRFTDVGEIIFRIGGNNDGC